MLENSGAVAEHEPCRLSGTWAVRELHQDAEARRNRRSAVPNHRRTGSACVRVYRTDLQSGSASVFSGTSMYRRVFAGTSMRWPGRISLASEEQGMADAQVTCINKLPRNDTHEGITHLGAANWKWPRQQVIDSIEAGTNTFFTMVNGKRAGRRCGRWTEWQVCKNACGRLLQRQFARPSRVSLDHDEFDSIECGGVSHDHPALPGQTRSTEDTCAPARDRFPFPDRSAPHIWNRSASPIGLPVRQV